MTPFEYYKTKSKDEVKRLCDAAGTTPAYFEQIARQYRNASIPLAKRLVKSSNGEMTLPEVIPALQDL
jgi:hypothetical protein